ncbi:H-NS histone family protein [Luteimonas sp. FCS-9]|uniref:H-NS histone family protein n=1 Tax=Luteimonas sp. FCS-9 TaxID=1547516 RepID=UPI00063EABE4|nr:H-NS histone family protein [Luteimonas sp. FCS-9]KLJ02544.1 DNA-binding protein [Luteimonas sp. FCS-9]
MKIDINELGQRELDSLLAAAEKRKQLLVSRRPIAAVRKDLIAFASSQGYTIEELVGGQPVSAAPKTSVTKTPARKRKRAKAAVKYRDPDNKRNTWSGRGRMPRWLAEKTKRGQSAADFLIPGLAKPTAKKSAPIGQRTVFKQGDHAALPDRES